MGFVVVVVVVVVVVRLQKCFLLYNHSQIGAFWDNRRNKFVCTSVFCIECVLCLLTQMLIWQMTSLEGEGCWAVVVIRLDVSRSWFFGSRIRPGADQHKVLMLDFWRAAPWLNMGSLYEKSSWFNREMLMVDSGFWSARFWKSGSWKSRF